MGSPGAFDPETDTIGSLRAASGGGGGGGSISADILIGELRHGRHVSFSARYKAAAAALYLLCLPACLPVAAIGQIWTQQQQQQERRRNSPLTWPERGYIALLQTGLPPAPLALAKLACN